MPIHDWTRVDAGVFHHFHGAWITHLAEALNGGVLPEDYYALAELRAIQMRPDVLTLHSGSPSSPTPGVLTPVAERPPRVALTRDANPDVAYRLARRTLAIRHKSGHRVVALVEIVSPANKDRRQSVVEFAQKVHDALSDGVSVLLIDLFPPGSHDPRGLHAAIWERYDNDAYVPPPADPLTLAAYAASDLPRAYVQPVHIGMPLPEMPLFLDPAWYVEAPLEAAYALAWARFPAYWKDVVENGAQGE